MFPSEVQDTTDLKSMLLASQITDSGAEGGKAFIRFDFESGEYTFGRDKEDITGEEIAINIRTFMHGWVIWSNGTPHKTVAHFTKPMPPEPAPMGGDMPSQSRGFEARFIDDAETVIVFSSNSFGGRKGCDKLLKEVMAKAGAGEAEYLFPVVELSSESYPNAKRGGKLTYNPKFVVTGWRNAEGVEQGAPQAKIETKAKAPTPAPEPEVKEAPKRRRRKSA